MTQVCPVQDDGAIRSLDRRIVERAYEVYNTLHPGQTLDDLNRRSGLSVGEIVAFLYARTFPRNEWAPRSNEAFNALTKAKEARRP